MKKIPGSGDVDLAIEKIERAKRGIACLTPHANVIPREGQQSVADRIEDLKAEQAVQEAIVRSGTLP